MRKTMTEKEAARYLGISLSSLRHSRLGTKGRTAWEPPPFLKIGRSVRYLQQDLDKWLNQHRVTGG